MVAEAKSDFNQWDIPNEVKRFLQTTGPVMDYHLRSNAASHAFDDYMPTNDDGFEEVHLRSNLSFDFTTILRNNSIDTSTRYGLFKHYHSHLSVALPQICSNVLV